MMTGFKLAFTFLAMSLIAFPQGTTSRVIGTVQDPSGSPVPGVSIKLTSEETNLTFETKSAENGAYFFESVKPGTYTVSVEAQGFKKFVSRGNRVQIGQPTTLNARLEIGNVVDVVDVVETAQQVQTSSSANLGSTLNQRTIQDIPIVGGRGRNILSALTYQPGVVSGGNTGGGVHVNGARDRSWNYTLDGIDVNETSAGGSNSSPVRTNPDMLQEFRVITANPSAENGRNSGGQVSMVTNSGSNQLKGSLFWFYRTPRLNANEWENNFNRVGKRNFVQNIGGVSIGGPIFKNKTFFYYNVQGLAATQTQVVTRTVYTATARQGLLRYVAGGQNGAAGAPNASVDLSGNVLPGRNLSTYNVVTSDPARRGLDRTLQALIAKSPLPNRFDVGDGLNTAGFVFSPDEAERQRDQTIRIDHIINPKNTIFGRMTYGYAKTLCDSVNGGLRIFPGADCLVNTNRTSYNAALNWRANPTPNITNELVAGWNQFLFAFPNPFFDLSRTSYSAPVAIAESYTFGNERQLKTAQLVENFSWLRGSHALKFGGNFRYQQHLDSRGSVGGVNVGQIVDFARATNVVDPTAFGIPADINQTVDRANFETHINYLLGRVGSITRAFVADGATDSFKADIFKFDARFPEYDFYMQDTWKVRRNLTIDVGLRWEFKGRPGNPDNRIFTPNQNITAGAPPSTTVRWAPGDLYGNQTKNWGPSLGFAWDPFGTGKTSVRANYRLAFDRIPTFLLSSFVFPNTPGTSIGVVNRTFGQGGGRLADLPNTTLPTQKPSALAQPIAYSDASITAVDPGLQTPKTNMWSFSLQREIAKRTVVEATYIGRRAYNLMGAYNVNQAEIFRNGFLEAFNVVKAGGESPLMNNLLRADTRVRAGESGSQFVRRQYGPSVNNNSVAFIANQLSRVLVGGQNLPAASGLGANFFNPYPQFGGGLTLIDSNDWSTYHALQVSLNRQFQTGASINLIYTLSKSLDTRSFDPTFTAAAGGAGQSASSSPFDIFNRKLNYGISDFDRTHVLQSTFVYELPFGKGQRVMGSAGPWLNRLIGGWQLGGLFRATSGRPFSVYSGENSFSSYVGAFADCNGCTRSDGQVKTENGFPWYFEPSLRSKFSLPAAGTLGNTGRNFFRGDMLVNLDLSFLKRTRITERLGFEIRADMTNFTNTPSFGFPTTTVTSPLFGRIGGSISSTARQTMLGAKLTF